MFKRIIICFFLAAGYLFVQSGISAAVAPCDVQLEPNLVTVGATYNGAKVGVTGTISDDAQVVIEVEGATAETTLLKKEHVFGLLWMNSGTVTLEGLPKVYMLYLPDDMAASKSDLGIGLAALKSRATVLPDDGTAAQKLDEFFKLKKKEGLYAIHEDAIAYGTKDGIRTFSCELKVPAAMHQGIYTVKTSVLQNGQVIETVSSPLKVEEVGLPALIRSLAFNHALLYGIMATLVAVFAGLLMGYIFQGEKGAH